MKTLLLKLSLASGFGSKYFGFIGGVATLLSLAFAQAKNTIQAVKEGVEDGLFSEELILAKEGMAKILSGLADIHQAFLQGKFKVENVPVYKDIQDSAKPVLATLEAVAAAAQPFEEEVKSFGKEYLKLKEAESGAVRSWLAKQEGYRRIIGEDFLEVTQVGFEAWTRESCNNRLYAEACMEEKVTYIKFKMTDGTQCIFWIPEGYHLLPEFSVH
jgi:hypothetical protein